MPFPIEEKYIIDTENILEVKFPPIFKKKMMSNNGGTLDPSQSSIEFIQLYPFFDKSSRKRIARTCNHIGAETKSAIDANYGFPTNAVSIGDDGTGNLIILMHNGNKQLDEFIYMWNHETGMIRKIGNSINELE